MNQEIKKPFYLNNEALTPFCVERVEKPTDKLFAFSEVLNALNAFPSILELIEQYTDLESKHGQRTLNGFIEMSKVYHSFASEQFEILRQETQLKND